MCFVDTHYKQCPHVPSDLLCAMLNQQQWNKLRVGTVVRLCRAVARVKRVRHLSRAQLRAGSSQCHWHLTIELSWGEPSKSLRVLNSRGKGQSESFLHSLTGYAPLMHPHYSLYPFISNSASCISLCTLPFLIVFLVFLSAPLFMTRSFHL